LLLLLAQNGQPGEEIRKLKGFKQLSHNFSGVFKFNFFALFCGLMKKLLFIFSALLIFAVMPSISQNKKIDSLLIVLKTEGEDTNKVNVLNNLGKRFIILGDYNTAKNYINNAKTLAATLKFKKGIAHAFSLIAFSNERQGNFSEALKNYFSALKIRREIGHKLSIAAIHNGIGNVYNSEGNYPEALKNHFAALKLREKMKDKQGIAASYNNIGNVYDNMGSFDESLRNHIASLNIKLEIGEKQGISDSYNNIGNIYFRQGKNPESLKNHFASLKIKEEIGNKLGIADSYMNIGNVYDAESNYSEALNNFLAALKICEEMSDKRRIANCYNNIAGIYYSKGDYPPALKNYIVSLKISEEIEDKKGIANSYLGIGIVFKKQGNITEAFKNYFASLKIREEIGEREGIASALGDIGEAYKDLKKYPEAEVSCLNELKISKEIGALYLTRSACLNLSEIYAATGRHQKSLESFKAYIKARDSIFNNENTRKTVQEQMNYEFNKKEQAAKVEQEKKDTIVKEEKHRQNLIRNAFIAGFILVFAIALLVFRSYRQKQKANKQLEEKNELIKMQKHIVEEKHKEITDSINYAERIQRSFLATKELLDENFKDYFVFFKPKDIVSGDFYWAAKLSNGQFALVTADSTGHGVPGAIMSILNISSLESAVKEGFLEPSDILNHTRTNIIERLKKDGSEHGGKDGMDCSLISFDFKNKTLRVANANNPVWIVRGTEVIEIKADKMAVGKHDNDKEPFTLKTINIFTGDVVYTLTDGFPDQFGGEKGKKFMTKKLKRFLALNVQLSMQEQKKLIETAFKNWAGKLEQVDDITVIGVRI
jgi:serine phosphatase RsbU (regulator of sigma subunit)